MRGWARPTAVINAEDSRLDTAVSALSAAGTQVYAVRVD